MPQLGMEMEMGMGMGVEVEVKMETEMEMEVVGIQVEVGGRIESVGLAVMEKLQIKNHSLRIYASLPFTFFFLQEKIN